jgi:hypothetical protein
MKLKMAALAPIAIVRSAMVAKPGLRRSERKPNLKSWRNSPMGARGASGRKDPKKGRVDE